MAPLNVDNLVFVHGIFYLSTYAGLINLAKDRIVGQVWRFAAEKLA